MRAVRMALVGIFLLGQLGGVVHHATTTHERCPEHGELVHAAPNGQGRALGLEVWASELTRHEVDPARAREFPSETRHDHDHCTIACTSRERATGSTSPDAIAVAVSASAEVADAIHLDRPARLAVYRTAPKTSPPA